VAVVESTATVLYAPAFWSKPGGGRKLMGGVRMGGRFRSQLAVLILWAKQDLLATWVCHGGNRRTAPRGSGRSD